MSETIFRVARPLLSNDKMIRRQTLEEYFSSGLIPFEQGKGSEWEITTFWPRDPQYYVDVHLESILADWQHPVSIEQLGSYRSFYKNCMISFYDSWSLYFWSLVGSFLKHTLGKDLTTLTLLHIDDHQDLNSPLVIEVDGEYRCLMRGKNMSFTDPLSIKDSIIAKSIGIDSFILPLLTQYDNINMFHIKYASGVAHTTQGLDLIKRSDSLLRPSEGHRIDVQFTDCPADHSYNINHTLSLPNAIDPNVPILLHIDCDAFINRYNLDTNWNPNSVSVELSRAQIEAKVDSLVTALAPLSNPIFVNIALSPGFFPSEYWTDICTLLLTSLENSGLVKRDAFSQYVNKHYPEELEYAIS